MQFQGKLLAQTWENGKKAEFQADFSWFGPNLGLRNFFPEFYLYEILDILLQAIIISNFKKN